MKNILLEKMFETSRWERIIEKSVFKGIDKGELRKYCSPNIRATLFLKIINQDLEFMPPYMAQIPKDTPNEYRTVFVGDTCERILCAIITECLFELFPDMVHKQCKSYQKGIGTGKIVQDLSSKIKSINSNIIGAKYDFHHYFDTVNRKTIMKQFDIVEHKLGMEHNSEPVMNLLRKTWNSDLCFDLDGNLIEQYNGIRQGNALGSWLADVVLYELDEYMSNKYQFYCRYSDDLIVIGENVEEITADINRIISKFGVSLNSKKTQTLYKDKWFKFLGFMIKGSQITLSPNRVKQFQKEIGKRSIGNLNYHVGGKIALKSINRYLYKGDGTYSWATQVLPIINVEKDIDTLNEFVMDCIRACQTGKRSIGGLGTVTNRKDCTILRGTGKNVSANRKNTEKEIEGYYSIRCMQKALNICRPVYDTIVREM